MFLSLSLYIYIYIYNFRCLYICLDDWFIYMLYICLYLDDYIYNFRCYHFYLNKCISDKILNRSRRWLLLYLGYFYEVSIGIFTILQIGILSDTWQLPHKHFCHIRVLTWIRRLETVKTHLECRQHQLQRKSVIPAQISAWRRLQLQPWFISTASNPEFAVSSKTENYWLVDEQRKRLFNLCNTPIQLLLRSWTNGSILLQMVSSQDAHWEPGLSLPDHL